MDNMRNYCKNSEGCGLLALLREAYDGEIPRFCRMYGTAAMESGAEASECPQTAYKEVVRLLQSGTLASDTLDNIGD